MSTKNELDQLEVFTELVKLITCHIWDWGKIPYSTLQVRAEHKETPQKGTAKIKFLHQGVFETCSFTRVVSGYLNIS